MSFGSSARKARAFASFACASVAAVVVGCAGSTPAAKAPQKCPPQNMLVSVLTSPQVNLSDRGEPRAVVARIYQLKSDARLLNATFEQVWNDDKNTLGEDLVKVDETLVYPSYRNDVKIQRTEAVSHVACVVLFENPKGRSWYSIFDLAPFPEAGKCEIEACFESDDCEERAIDKLQLAFYADGSKVDDGVDHVEEYPEPGKANLAPKGAHKAETRR